MRKFKLEEGATINKGMDQVGRHIVNGTTYVFADAYEQLLILSANQVNQYKKTIRNLREANE